MKLHPFTAVRDAVAYGIRFGSFGFFGGLMGTTVGLLPGSAEFVLAVVGFLVGVVYGAARYAIFEYELGERTLEITSGVLRRQEREIPLGRVQNVDVEQSFLQRLLGLAVVRFETAGGGETEGKLQFVGIEEAESLQADLRRRKRAARAGAGAESDAEPAAVEPEPTLLFQLSLSELLVLAGVSFRWGVAPLLAFTYPLVEDVLFGLLERLIRWLARRGESILGDPRVLLVVAAGVLGYIVLTWLVGAVITVLRYYDFRLSRIDDELVYERGLLQRYSGTIPLDKVQTVSVEENLLMRQFGYAALSVETAGYGSGGNGETGRSPSAIPLADRDTVLALAESIEGVGDTSVERPPRRARRRYAGRYALAVLGATAGFAVVHLSLWSLGVLWALPVAALVAALPAAHLKWANRGHRTDDHHFLARDGVWRRRTQIVPYYRLQTVLTVQTVFQRRWSLASVVGDTASSSSLLSREATAHDVDLAVARDLHDTLRERLRADVAERRVARGENRRQATVPTVDVADAVDGVDGPESTGPTPGEEVAERRDGEGHQDDEDRSDDDDRSNAGEQSVAEDRPDRENQQGEEDQLDEEERGESTDVDGGSGGGRADEPSGSEENGRHGPDED